jgi:glycosyltransferase involved in cell wall biosynthesis
MRIGVDVRLISQEMTGIGKHATGLLNELLKLDKENEYILYGYGNEKLDNLLRHNNAFYKRIGVSLGKRFQPNLGKIIWEQIKLPREIKRDSIDLFYSPWFDVPLYSLNTKLKTIVTIYDISTLIFSGQSSYKFRLYYTPLIKVVSKRANKILTLSNNSKKDIMEKLNVPEDKILITYSGCDSCFKNFEITSEHEGVFHRYNVNKPYILYTGGIAPRKNVEILLKAFSEIRKQGFGGDLISTARWNLPIDIRKLS